MRYELSTTSLRAGLETVRLHNKGTEPHQVQLLRLHDGKSLSDLSTVLANPKGDPLTVADATGGSNTVLPGGEQVSYVNLRAGNYVALCFVTDEENVPHFADRPGGDNRTPKAPSPDSASDSPFRRMSTVTPSTGSRTSATLTHTS